MRFDKGSHDLPHLVAQLVGHVPAPSDKPKRSATAHQKTGLYGADSGDTAIDNVSTPGENAPSFTEETPPNALDITDKASLTKTRRTGRRRFTLTQRGTWGPVGAIAAGTIAGAVPDEGAQGLFLGPP
jgi:hypothetical protein